MKMASASGFQVCSVVSQRFRSRLCEPQAPFGIRFSRSAVGVEHVADAVILPKRRLKCAVADSHEMKMLSINKVDLWKRRTRLTITRRRAHVADIACQCC